jgi:hypothetical protein
MNTESWKYATPQQHNLYRYVKSLLVGVQTITPLFYEGTIAGSEFITYDAKKVYLCLEGWFSYGGVPENPNPYMILNNMLNATMCLISKTTAYWDVTAAAPKWSPVIMEVKNIWFSCVISSGYSYMQFNGYKITIP